MGGEPFGMPHIKVTLSPSLMFPGTGRTVSKGFPTGTKHKRTSQQLTHKETNESHKIRLCFCHCLNP